MIQFFNNLANLGSLGLAGLICLGVVGCTTGNKIKPKNWHALQPSFTAPTQQSVAQGKNNWLKNSMSNMVAGITPSAKTVKSKDATNLDVMPVGGVDSTVYVMAGQLSATRQQWTEAIEHFKTAIKMDPANVDAITGCAAVLTEQGKFKEAIKFYRHAVKASDETEALELASEISYCFLQLGQQDKAISILEALVHNEPGNSMFRRQLAYALTQNGDANSALKHLAAIMNPTEALMNLGEIQSELGMTEQAKTSYERAYAQNGLEEALVRAQKLGSTLAANGSIDQSANEVKTQDYLKPVQGSESRSQNTNARVNYDQPSTPRTRQTLAADLQPFQVESFETAQEASDAKFREKLQSLQAKIDAQTSKPIATFRPMSETSRAIARFSAKTKKSDDTKTAKLPESISSLLLQ